MIQKHSKLINEVNHFKKCTSSFGQVQKIFSTSRYICLVVRYLGKTNYLYLGRGSGHEGFFWGKRLPPKELRVQDNFLKYLRKYLRGGKLEDIQVDVHDRILTFSYLKREKNNYLLLFWRGRKLYFLNDFYDVESLKQTTFLSWKGKIVNKDNINCTEELKSYFDSIGRITSTDPSIAKKEEVSAARDISIEELLNIEIKEVLRRVDKRKTKFLLRKREKIKNDLLKNQKWPEIKKMADKRLQDGDTDFLRKKDAIYQKIKRMKRGERILEERLYSVNEEINNSEKEEGIFKLRKKVISPVWTLKKKKKEKIEQIEEKKEIIEYTIEDKVKMAFGQSDKGNDYLRSRWSKKEDLWFHLEGYKGAHGVVKINSITQLNSKSIEIIASVLNDLSNLHLTQIPLVFTQVKYIKGVKGSAGKVIIKKEKYLQVNYLNNWKTFLKINNGEE